MSDSELDNMSFDELRREAERLLAEMRVIKDMDPATFTQADYDRFKELEARIRRIHDADDRKKRRKPRGRFGSLMGR